MWLLSPVGEIVAIVVHCKIPFTMWVDERTREPPGSRPVALDIRGNPLGLPRLLRRRVRLALCLVGLALLVLALAIHAVAAVGGVVQLVGVLGMNVSPQERGHGA
jgi:hypothetical protein